jgi:hypothetical protein
VRLLAAGFNQKLFTAGWGMGSEAKASLQAKKGRDARRTGTVGAEGSIGDEGEEDIWSGVQTEEFIRELKIPFAIAAFGSRELMTSEDIRGIVTAGDRIIAGKESCVVKAVLKDRLVIEEPYVRSPYCRRAPSVGTACCHHPALLLSPPIVAYVAGRLPCVRPQLVAFVALGAFASP